MYIKVPHYSAIITPNVPSIAKTIPTRIPIYNQVFSDLDNSSLKTDNLK